VMLVITIWLVAHTEENSAVYILFAAARRNAAVTFVMHVVTGMYNQRGYVFGLAINSATAYWIVLSDNVNVSKDGTVTVGAVAAIVMLYVIASTEEMSSDKAPLLGRHRSSDGC
jgi:hypothetical protein